VTGIPVIWYGITDLEFSKDKFLTEPGLYRVGPSNVYSNTPLFLANIFNGIFNALFITFVCFYAMDGNVITWQGINGYFWQDSTLVMGVVVMVVNLRVL